MKANSFYDLISSHRLKANHCFYKSDGTTKLKLEILIHALNFPYNAIMVGNYNYSHPYLYTTKLCGGITSCIGFINANKTFYPSTILKEDIRNITEKPFPIIMICCKHKTKLKYKQITRKGRLYNQDIIPIQIKELMDINIFN